MIELREDGLVFTAPEVHPEAVLRVELERTLRIPDDDRSYPLPPGLGAFPMRHVDDHADRLGQSWLRRGGVMVPMYQSEALWISFHSPEAYPWAVQVAAGKVNAVTGEPWREELGSEPQDYVVVPGQPWLDGYCVAEGQVRQFVAMPLGSEYTVEEQLTGQAEHGGLQISAVPLKAEVWRRRRREFRRTIRRGPLAMDMALCVSEASASMGLAAGGRMDQEIYRDREAIENWEQEARNRCFVHLANALVWRSITGQEPPPTPVTVEEYARSGLPWFEWYDGDREALAGAAALAGVKSVAEMAREKGDAPPVGGASTTPGSVVRLGPERGPHEVRQEGF
ncbi:MAG: hypothetical protein WEB88_03465 [Gemmatimonadota bacterium]